jgi:hypothetical protein
VTPAFSLAEYEMSSEAEAARLRDHFLGWQCRIRQIAVREDGGRPSPGMQPRVLNGAGRVLSPALTVLIVPKAPAESTAFFRFQVQKSPDPRDVYERGLAFLQAEYFQQTQEFADALTAVLPEDSELATTLLADAGCVLEFLQFRQFYRLPCAVFAHAPEDPARDATLWHNRLFNPTLPDAVHVLAFRPDWAAAEAKPGP